MQNDRVVGSRTEKSSFQSFKFVRKMSVVILLAEPRSQEREVTVSGLIQSMERVITRFIDIKPVSRNAPL
jgi:hypothetical protein